MLEGEQSCKLEHYRTKQDNWPYGYLATGSRDLDVNDEFVPFHMDDEAGRRAGNKEGAFGMGNLRYAYLVNALRDWIGDEAEVREIGCQYRAINQKNDTLSVVGKVVEKAVVDGENRVKLTTNVMNQEGEATCPGHAVVVLPNRPA